MEAGVMVSIGSRPAPPEALERVLRWLPPLVRLELALEAEEPVELPAWTGSALHGALGWALAEVACSNVCAARHDAEPGRCPYARLFDVVAGRPGLSPHIAAMPVPALALRPPPPVRASVLRPGERWSFAAHVIGSEAIGDIRPLLAAVARMGERGIGKGRGRARLASARSGGRELWVSDRLDGEPQVVPASDWAARREARGVRLRSITPLHLRRSGELDRTPTFERIVDASLRRLVALAAHRGGGEPEVHVNDLGRSLSAGAGPVVARWEAFSTKRWSERQRRRHEVEGVLGELSCEDAGAATTILLAAAEVGVGKGTAMGMGCIEIEHWPLVTAPSAHPFDGEEGNPRASEPGPAPVVRRSDGGTPERSDS